ncbi:MAG TPA: DUF4011 domain-containing protein [Fimbriiglobus sp.]|nr:DUF4011 domain-containing protein [Fimbriiglobus sp.]
MPFDIDARIADWQKQLLDTTKRNRLIKFVSGRAGGVGLLHPGFGPLWQRMVVDGQPCVFAWKRDVLGLPAEAIDGVDEPSPDPGVEGTGISSPNLFDAVPPASTTPSPPVAAPSLRDLTARCLASPRLRPDHLLTEFTDKKLAAHLLRLHRTASEAETDHGVSTLFAAFGFLKWFEDANSTEEVRSPLVLVPVRLSRESVESAWTLREEDEEPVTNHCLAELLATDFRVKLPADADVDTDGPDGLTAYLRRVAGLVKAMPRWEVVEETALGVFNFQKLAMWKDLKRNADRIKSHDLCRAIAGDPTVALRPPAGLPAAADLDEKVPPETVTHILDADSSQHEGIEATKRGANVVIDGPPGTGKSQTIANAIAELLAAGKTVLFVSEKTAALEVVKDRLDRCGLGDFCLELHSHKANKREVTTELGRCLEIGPETHQDVTAELRQLAEVRRRLNDYADELHRPRPPLGLTAFQAHGELARLANLTDSTRWTAPDVFARDADFLRRATDTLAGLTKCRPVIEDPTGHPWRGCRVAAVTQTGLDDARYHLDRLATATARLSDGTTLADLALEGLNDTVAQWRKAVAFARSVLDVPQVPADWFDADPLAATAAASGLHSATKQARELAGRLGGFSSEAVRSLTPAAVSELAAGLKSSRELLVNGSALSARERIGALRSLIERLNATTPMITTLADNYGRLAAALRLPGKTPPLAQTRKIAQVAGEVANSSPVPSSWWEPTRRIELQNVVIRGADEDAASQTMRANLVATFTPAAFAPEAGPVVRDACRHIGSFWRRLLPRWRTVKQQVVGWYTGTIPDRAKMVADLHELTEYHKRADYIRQVEAGYAADLVTGPTGRPNWVATSDRLKAVDRYEKWKLPAELKAAMAPSGDLDRAALADVARQVLQAEAALQTVWVTLLTTYAPGDAANALQRPPADLAAAIRADAGAAESEATSLERVVSLLRDGQDLPGNARTARTGELIELVSIRSRSADLARQLGVSDPPETVEAKDWSDWATAAEKLSAFLKRTAHPPSQRTIAALTEPETRNRIEAGVRLSDAMIGDGFDESWDYLTGSLFDPDAAISDGVTLSGVTIPDLARWSRARAADTHRLEEWVRYVQVRRDAAALGIESVVAEVCGGRIALDRAADAFRKRFLGLWLDALYEQVPVLREFAADGHDERIERFIRLDRRSIALAPARLRSHLLTHPNRPTTDGAAPPSSELGILLREANKKRRHLPLRKLFTQVPTVLPRLKPCLMMSPLAVSTYLNSPDVQFDVVIFDEASQVRPHDAVCAVYRAHQLVVAGDPKQLPPTDFFTRSVADDPDADDADEGTAGFESLLDVCLSLGLTRKRLKWHYRSRHEGLIAFSNKFFYNNDLVTFPSVDDGSQPAVRFEFVPDGRFESGVNVVEARRTAEQVIAHFRTTPDRSLGVIAFSQQQQNRILDELEVQRKANPDLEGFFKEDRAERFFVKNLENVQGDERDFIILSVGYGPDAAGKVAMRFGPLNRQGGERRLNVAVTRARYAMAVVASMTSADIDLGRTQADGPRLLKAFLDYAERGPRALTEAITGANAAGFDSPFEQEVHDELRRRGLTVHRQVGCGGFKIDLAVTDPAAGGLYLLGVECDGRTYHSSATARDRDRLRQAVLEGLGWRLCRVWSTDWLRNREKQVQRVLAAVEAARRPRPTPPEPPPPVETVRPQGTKPIPVATPAFANIEDVPEGTIRSELSSLLADVGSTEPGDMCKAVSLRLGFKRLGPKIEARIEAALEALTREGKVVHQDDGRIRAV